MTEWEKNICNENQNRIGIRFRYDKNVDPEVKRAISQFAIWLRSKYHFPFRVQVYVKSGETIRTYDGDNVVGSFFEPTLFSDESYVRIATGDYNELVCSIGKDNALASILATLAHELTHYFQWINNVQLTDIGKERQAMRYAEYIVDEYSSFYDHP